MSTWKGRPCPKRNEKINNKGHKKSVVYVTKAMNLVSIIQQKLFTRSTCMRCNALAPFPSVPEPHETDRDPEPLYLLGTTWIEELECSGDSTEIHHEYDVLLCTSYH